MQLNDTDPRPGWIAGNISFGPNAVDGYINEDPVESYAVYFVDSCGVLVGGAVASVPKRPGVPSYCCLNDAYVANIAARIPSGSDRLVIVPMTSTGPLPVGELTALISDLVVNKTAVVAVANGAVTRSLPRCILASVTFVAAATLFTSRRD